MHLWRLAVAATCVFLVGHAEELRIKRQATNAPTIRGALPPARPLGVVGLSTGISGFRPIGGTETSKPPTTTTISTTTTKTPTTMTTTSTTTPTPTTTTPATTTLPPAPTPAPQHSVTGLETGISGIVVADSLKNVSLGPGTRPPKDLNEINATRPDTLDKSGKLRRKMAQDDADEGNDQPVDPQSSDLLNELFNEEPLKQTRPINVVPVEAPGPPAPLVLPVAGQVRNGANDGVVVTVSNVGSEFWIAFMDNRVENPTNQPLEIYIAAGHYEAGAKATVSMWYSNPYGRKEEIFDQTSVPSDSVKIFTVPSYMRNVVNGVFKKGIRIVSDRPVSVYGFNYEPFSADAFRVLPVEALSSHYIAVTYGQPTNLRTQIACTAVRDSTLVQITLPLAPPVGVTPPVVDIDGLRYYPGETFNKTINAFDVLAVRSVGDLTGADILSNEKIACFSGNVRSHVGNTPNGASRDHLAVQLLPVSTWRFEFAIAPSPSGKAGVSLGGEHIIVTSQPDTRITITGSGAPVSILVKQARDKYKIEDLNVFTHVIADKPIQIVQILGSQNGDNSDAVGDPSMLMISAINQYSSMPETVLPPTGQFGYINKLMIFIDRDAVGGLRMNRRRRTVIGTNGWTRVPNTRLVGRLIDVDTDRLTQVYHIDSTVPFLVQYYGFSDRESYAFEGSISLTLACDFTPSIPGDEVDNDCDGKADEELIDNLDNDGDGLIDEDNMIRLPFQLIGGKEYILAFMESSAETFGQLNHLYLSVAPDADATDVDVTISQPLMGNRGFPNSTIRITKGRFHMVNLDPQPSVIYGTTRSNRAILVRASDRVVLYALNRKLYSMDGNLVLPVDRLGTDYYTASFSPSQVGSEFAVIATEPNTTVEIVFPKEVVNTPWAVGSLQVPWQGLMYSNLNKLSLTLSQYEAVQLQSLATSNVSPFQRGDLTGTRITSNKPIAVFSGNGHSNPAFPRSRDSMAEQMPPISSWGKEYIVTPTPGRTVGEYYRIIASAPNTNVIVDRSDGGYDTFVLQTGEFNQIDVRTGGVSAAIYADNPVLVVLFMKDQAAAKPTEPGAPAMIVIPHTYQYVHEVHFATPIADYQDFYLTVVIQRKFQNGLRLNGVLVNSTMFTLTPRLAKRLYAYAIIGIVQGADYSLEHDDPAATFFSQIYGVRDREAVGYALGVNWPIQTKGFVYQPVTPTIPGAWGFDPYDIYTVELCGDGIDNDGDFLVDEDCTHAHEYYAMFLTNTVPDPLDHSLEIHCVSSSNQNHVRLTTGFINRKLARHEVEKSVIQEVTLNRDQTVLFTVPGYYRAQLSRSGYFDTQYKGVVVESDWALDCYAFNKDTDSADGWLMKDYSELGTKYIVSSGWPYTNRQLVGLLGTEQDTTVNVTIPGTTDPNLFYTYLDVNGFRYFAGETFTIRLNRLQIFQIDTNSRFDMSGMFISSDKPIAVIAGNERNSFPTKNGVDRDHASDQIPRLPLGSDLDVSHYNTSYRYDVLPTITGMIADTYQCVGWSAGTTLRIKQSGVQLSTRLLEFQGVTKIELPSSGGPVQIFSNKPVMCEQFVWTEDVQPSSSPEMAANILSSTYYGSRPWFRFVAPKISTLADDYQTYVGVSFNLAQLYAGEGAAFFLDGYWLDRIDAVVIGDQAFFKINDLKSGTHAISSAIVDLSTNSIKNALMRFNIQIHMHSEYESIAMSPAPELLYNTL